ncbi:MAG: imidazolonepropionase [Bryobacteraceae bacterium]|nr:imidazolonepropionase [Bryobacteraceae bacterium]
MSTLGITGCAQLVTLAGPPRPRVHGEMRDLGLVADGALLIRDGKIAAAGPRSQVEPLFGAETRVIHAGGRVVLPGFVDAHSHPVFAGNRADEFEKRIEGVTYKELAEQGGGILATVRKTREAPETQLLDAARGFALRFLRGGTTTVEAKSGYGLSLDQELKLLRVIRRLNGFASPRYVPTFLGAHEVPAEFRGRAGEYIRVVIEDMLPRVAEEKLALFCDIFCEPHVFDVAQSRRILSAAKRLGFELRMHVDQLGDSGGAMLAAELGARTADHLEHTGGQGIAALRSAGVQPVLLPGSVYGLGLKHYPRARAMIDAGLAVVIATDFNPGSSPVASMPLILSLACTQMRMTPAEAITAATINAAYSLNLGGRVGSLETEKVADVVIHDCADYREIPYWIGNTPVHAVFAAGEPVAI